MKKSKQEIEERQQKVRELILKGSSDTEIVKALSLSPKVLEGDKEAISAAYLKAVTENRGLMEKHAEHVLKHLDQLDMIKKRLWEIDAQAQAQIGQEAPNVKAQLEALKTILTELDHESKILKLIDTQQTVIKNYIHIDKLNVLMTKITEVVKEFVPQERQKYAFERLKDAGEILDTECSNVGEKDE